jgi:hypothetical protein
MDIYKHFDFSALKSLPNHIFHAVDFRRVPHAWILPLSVKIVTSQTTPIVTNHNTIRIEHRDYFEYKHISEQHSFDFVTHKELYHTLYNEGGVRLSWMDSRTYDYS